MYDKDPLLEKEAKIKLKTSSFWRTIGTPFYLTALEEDPLMNSFRLEMQIHCNFFPSLKFSALVKVNAEHTEYNNKNFLFHMLFFMLLKAHCYLPVVPFLVTPVFTYYLSICLLVPGVIVLVRGAVNHLKGCSWLMSNSRKIKWMKWDPGWQSNRKSNTVVPKSSQKLPYHNMGLCSKLTGLWKNEGKKFCVPNKPF